MSNQPIDALDDPEYRKQVQGLKDVTAALKGEPSSPVIFSTDAESVLNRKMANMKLSEYLGGLRQASTAEELEAAIQAPYKHAFHGRTWTTICKVRTDVGNAIVAAHPLGKFVPRMIGRRLTVVGETYGVSRGGNSTGVRYAWHAAGEFAKSVLKRHGFTTRAASRIWDSWSDYPHRCLAVVEKALAGGYQDPVMDTLIFCYTGGGPVNITVEENNADDCGKRATMSCKCGGTLFDWGCGFSDDFTHVSWHCNQCADVYTEHVTPQRFREIRQPRLTVTA